YAFDAMNHTIEDPGRAARSAATARRLAEGVTAVHPVVTLMGALVRGPDTSIASAMAELAELAGHPDPWVAAEAELWLAHADEFTGDAAGSLAHFASARDRFTALGDRWGLASAMSSLATGYGLTADHTAAITAFSEAERLAALAGAPDDLTAARESARDRRSTDLVALADAGLGDLARRRGDLAGARARLTGALASLGQVASPTAETSRIPALTGLGRV